MKTITKLMFATTAAVCSLIAASAASAAVSISVTQSGSNVLFSGSGTFNSAVANSVGQGLSNADVDASTGYLSFGEFELINVYSLAGMARFGTGFAYIEANTGPALGFRVSDGAFYLGMSYVDNSLISSSGIVRNATLTTLGLTSGVYNYAVGGNVVTLNIGPVVAAVPEPATWLTMILGFGMMGASMRYRRRTKEVYV
ncbi:PEPxxWA-CTERM sorting domain-containing protein [Sphingomonas sp. PAMC 26621]|uniref:PEPxxWA-CTERM sorting domain-containing protein n=1 Tax=Sphingomonas sp. PAMC 26621 TaxID=1112213 RepID=UPI001478BA00|nr:PEPxxWA-CTERM sorting domain-containing protein [Sphingomonas sp. PAMC 26621]